MCGPWPECEKRLSRLLAIKVSDELAMPTERTKCVRGLMMASWGHRAKGKGFFRNW